METEDRRLDANDSPADPKVFLSHSSDDVEVARELRQWLSREGFEVWMAPDDIRGSTSWAEQIETAISSATSILVLLSGRSTQSAHVAREVNLALEEGKSIVPVRIEPVSLSGSLRYLLSLTQWVDLFPLPWSDHRTDLIVRLRADADNQRPARSLLALEANRNHSLPQLSIGLIGRGAAMGLPAGVVTFVFTDVEGSTGLFGDLGDAFATLLEERNAILREVWRAHRGVEVSTEGDAFFVAFSDPADAVRACVEAVDRIDDHRWPDGARFRIRAGVHTGVAYPRDGSYIALPVRQAARIGAVGHGGQVVVSAATAGLSGSLTDIHLHDLGAYRVRDFDGPVRLFQAERAADPTSHPRLRTEADVLHNLPVEASELIGRGDDLAGVEEQMGRSRLVSLVGPGGVGKTTLAVAVARRAVDRYRHGVWFVDLSSHDEASTLRGAIADVVGVESEQLDEALAGKELVLVLDNCEQAAAAVAEVVTDLMASCASVSFLVTSREPLAVASERLWRLEPFSGPDAAVALFVARAQAVAPGFDGDADHEVLVELCRRLDGLPLAIELAAARVSAMTPAEILESLTEGLGVLRSRRRDLDPRRRTATGLVEWSYRLLDEEEQLVLRRIGILRDHFTIDTVAAMVEDQGLGRVDVADIIWSLVDKSLVMPVPVAGGTRYRTLETTRAFAQKSLADAGERPDAEVALGRWYLARFDPTRPQDLDTMAQLRDEYNNMRALVADLADHDPGLGQWLAWALGAHLRITDPARGVVELASLVERLDVPGEAVTGMWAIYGQLHVALGDPDTALAAIDAAQRHTDQHGPRPIGQGRMSTVRALATILNGEPAAGRDIARAALEDATEHEQIPLLNAISIAAIELGDFEAAQAALEGVLNAARRLDEAGAAAAAYSGLAEIELRRGELLDSAVHVREALRFDSELGMGTAVGLDLTCVARILAANQHWQDAVVLHRAGEAIHDRTGSVMFDSDQRLRRRFLDDARQALGDGPFHTASARGRELDESVATRLALDKLDAYIAKTNSD